MFAFKLFTAGLALLAPLAAAYTQPSGDAPEGNPIYKPGQGDILPAGKPFDITWGPTTNGTVTLVLLKGPSNNAVQQYAIAQSIDNTGSFSWTPSTSLAPGTSGYGILLIVDATGQYQYSTQFGIKNDDPTPSSSSSSSSVAASTASSTTSTVVIMETISSSTIVATVTAASSSSTSSDEASSTSSSVTQIVGTNSASTTLQTSASSSTSTTASSTSSASRTTTATATATPYKGDAAAFRAGGAVGLALAAAAAVLAC